MRIVASDCADGNLIITTALQKSTVKRKRYVRNRTCWFFCKFIYKYLPTPL